MSTVAPSVAPRRGLSSLYCNWGRHEASSASGLNFASIWSEFVECTYLFLVCDKVTMLCSTRWLTPFHIWVYSQLQVDCYNLYLHLSSHFSQSHGALLLPGVDRLGLSDWICPVSVRPSLSTDKAKQAI